MIVKRDFTYTPTGKNRPLHIYLPDNYEESKLKFYVDLGIKGIVLLSLISLL